MIKPSRHNHPDKTIVFVSYLILNTLSNRRVMKYEKLLELVKARVTGAEFLFLPALNFLYLLGVIDYKPKTDSIEYIEKQK